MDTEPDKERDFRKELKKIKGIEENDTYFASFDGSFVLHYIEEVLDALDKKDKEIERHMN